jgi:RNA recognition motif-containing protein
MASEDARKLFVAGLPDSVTEEVLRGLFSESGTRVAELTLPRDRMSGRPRGFAFVRLESTEDANRARQVLDGRILDGKSISVRPFQPDPPTRREGASAPAGGDRSDRPDRPPRREFGGGGAAGPAPDRTLYVGNLPYDATPEEVEATLTGYGVEGVARVHLPVDPDGRRRGFGFVTIGTTEAAKNAIDLLRAADLRGRRLIINLAHPKGSAPGGAPGDADRAPRPFDGGAPRFRPPSGAPDNGTPRFNGGPPPAFGPPAAKATDQRRKRKFEGEGEGGARQKGRREQEDRWRDDDDD